MKKVYLILFLYGLGRAQSGLDLTFQKPFGGSVAGRTAIAALSYYSPSWNRLAGFSEYGLVGMPPLGFSEEDPVDHRRTTSFVGLYAGHLFLLYGGRLRPGFTLGTVWEETVQPEWAQAPDSEVFRRRNTTDSKFGPYFAFKVQASLFSFIFSNRGLGAGINLTL
jgi:hypothetical protein